MNKQIQRSSVYSMLGSFDGIQASFDRIPGSFDLIYRTIFPDIPG